jgi:hypothetical protein
LLDAMMSPFASRSARRNQQFSASSPSCDSAWLICCATRVRRGRRACRAASSPAPPARGRRRRASIARAGRALLFGIIPHVSEGFPANRDFIAAAGIEPAFSYDRKRISRRALRLTAPSVPTAWCATRRLCAAGTRSQSRTCSDSGKCARGCNPARPNGSEPCCASRHCRLREARFRVRFFAIRLSRMRAGAARHDVKALVAADRDLDRSPAVRAMMAANADLQRMGYKLGQLAPSGKD